MNMNTYCAGTGFNSWKGCCLCFSIKSPFLAPRSLSCLYLPTVMLRGVLSSASRLSRVAHLRQTLASRASPASGVRSFSVRFLHTPWAQDNGWLQNLSLIETFWCVCVVFMLLVELLAEPIECTRRETRCDLTCLQGNVVSCLFSRLVVRL